MIDEAHCRNRYGKPGKNSLYEVYKNKMETSAKLSYEKIRHLSELGFTQFKLCGRNTWPLSQILEYADYLIKEEYREEFIITMIDELKESVFRTTV